MSHDEVNSKESKIARLVFVECCSLFRGPRWGVWLVVFI